MLDMIIAGFANIIEGTHLPDITVITPAFDESGDRILFYVGMYKPASTIFFRSKQLLSY